MINKKLTPFRWCMLQTFPFIEATFDAIDNYGLLCKIVEYVNKNIDKTNELGIKVEELNNWFNNLDVQDEINKKLDEMAESGELAQIISQYIELQGLFCFNNIQDLKNAENLTVGKFIKTAGYYSSNDGGGAFYRIRNITVDDNIDEGHLISLTGTLVAEIVITNNKLNVLQFGAKNDNSIDNTDIFNNIQNFADNIYIPKGNYKINGTITYLRNNIKFYGDGISATNLIVGTNRRNQTIKANSLNNIYLGNLTIDTDNGSIEGALHWSGVQDSIIENVEFLNGDLTTMLISGNSHLYPSTQNGKNITIINCIAKNQKNFVPDGTASFIAGDGAENITFENCIAIDCLADAFDSDNANNTRFINCQAISTNSNINFYGFWSEGEQADTNVYWENCTVKGYNNGIGVSELVKGYINNCNFYNITNGRSIWVRNTAKINNCIFKNCYLNDESNGAILIENEATIENCKFLNDNFSLNRQTVIANYSGAGLSNKIMNIINCEFNNSDVQIGYTNTSSSKINIYNSNFYNSRIYGFDNGSKFLNVINCIFNTELDFTVINLARINKSFIKNCNFICTTNSTKPAISCGIDTFNLYIKDCVFNGFQNSAENSTLLLGNILDNQEEYNLFDYELIQREVIDITDTNNYYQTKIGVASSGIAIIRNLNPDGARTIIAFADTAYGVIPGIINKLVESPVYSTSNKFDIIFNEAENLKIKSPMIGKVEIIILGLTYK